MTEGPHRRVRGNLVRTTTSVALPARRRFWRQVSNHSVALISLALAAISLGYNTWRNETTEIQRNWRQASFQVLVELGELNQIVLYRRYFQAPGDRAEPDAAQAINRVQDAQTWVAGWGKVTMIRDLTSFMPEPLASHGSELFDRWSTHAARLDDQDPANRRAAERALLETIETLRAALVELIDNLR
ncbi:MAG: hypothetical protein RQ729_08420 [Wenzhouxiangellaceae bacterium]|nr:hypothetical protein [Wenzhouxiangellaceae bacterium]